MDKCGFFLCTGCGIDDVVDAKKLLGIAKKEGKAAFTVSHPKLCDPQGLQVIRDAMEKEGLDAVVLGACSQREMTSVFKFDGTFVDRVALREFVAWSCGGDDDEDKQMMAEDYVRMGCVRAQKAKKSEPVIMEEVTRVILVVGGGVAGMSAALEAAAAGYDVTLVEKTDALGGLMAGWHKRIPSGGDWSKAQDNDVSTLIEAVKNEPRINVCTATEVASISGAPGQYEVTLRGKSAAQVKIGAIVVAVGGKTYDADKLGELGFGKSANVITSAQLEQMAKEGKLVRPSDGKPIESVAFIQCAGSRDEKHLAYCSVYCCPTTLKQAGYLRQANPKTRTYVLYKDMRCQGLMENYYRQTQSEGTIFIKTQIQQVDASNGMVKVRADDLLSGVELDLEVDVVVLATGVEPLTKEAEILNLTYRLGKELPVRDYGFPNSHFICFPYETQRTGIYAAGIVRQPMDSRAAINDGAGAALKAMQCVEAAAAGVAVHPRSMDITYPDFFLQRCTQCKRCTEECPFGTLDEDEKGTPKPNPTRCRRCGICMGACPERIISFANYSVDMVGSMIKSIEVPDEDEEKPRVLALVCENDALPGLDMAAQLRLKVSPWVRFVPLRCLGSMNLQWVNDTLIKGFDGVMLIGCKFGDDYQCHFIKGSELCSVRLEKIQETLTRLMLEPERIKLVQFEMGDAANLPGIINSFVEATEKLGPNPNKGF
jgi:quinone-modifying oxidoreductase subunit QmoB